MKYSLISAIAAAAIALSATCAAAEEISGRVLEIDREAQTLTLDNGATFTISEEVSLEGLTAGQEVTVTFEQRDADKVATEIGRPKN
jgi:Cu/Ag efflux protein CusF